VGGFMRNVIEEFCQEIKVDYFIYLYNKGNSLSFPKCCKLSADIITSFLKMVCDDRFKYICTTRVNAYNHAWTYYKDQQEEFIIDFTNLQYTNSNSELIRQGKFSVEELRMILVKEKVVFDPEETYMYITYNWMYPKEQKCFGILEKFSGSLSKNSFMEYLEQSYDIVFDKTNYF
jgi:hypothetical protein